jgi:hypothetical protein
MGGLDWWNDAAIPAETAEVDCGSKAKSKSEALPHTLKA